MGRCRCRWEGAAGAAEATTSCCQTSTRTAPRCSTSHFCGGWILSLRRSSSLLPTSPSTSSTPISTSGYGARLLLTIPFPRPALLAVFHWFRSLFSGVGPSQRRKDVEGSLFVVKRLVFFLFACVVHVVCLVLCPISSAFLESAVCCCPLRSGYLYYKRYGG